MASKEGYSRRTAFPSMWLKSMKVETPPFDEDGVVQEFVGRGITRDFEPFKEAGQITQERIGSEIQSIQQDFDLVADEFKIRYNLYVKVPVDNPFSERGVSARARTWTRLKNPFETDVIEVSNPTKDESLSGDDFGTVYKVSTTVRK